MKNMIKGPYETGVKTDMKSDVKWYVLWEEGNNSSFINKFFVLCGNDNLSQTRSFHNSCMRICLVCGEFQKRQMGC